MPRIRIRGVCFRPNLKDLNKDRMNDLIECNINERYETSRDVYFRSKNVKLKGLKRPNK